MNTVEKIFFDMDGVLADFDGTVNAICDFDIGDQDRPNALDEKMWDTLKQIPHFYATLPPLPGAVEMFFAIHAVYGERCEILTGIPKAKRGLTTSAEDKIDWIHRYLAEDIVVHTLHKEDKPTFCSGPSCILIDDSANNIRNWEEYGGIGILHTSPEETLKQLRDGGYLD